MKNSFKVFLGGFVKGLPDGIIGGLILSFLLIFLAYIVVLCDWLAGGGDKMDILKAGIIITATFNAVSPLIFRDQDFKAPNSLGWIVVIILIVF